jgi:hypothetical protein
MMAGLVNLLTKLFGSRGRPAAIDVPSTPSAPVKKGLPVASVFSITTLAPYSYIDRAVDSSSDATRRKVRQLKAALSQEGPIVCIFGESKTGKTTFARKTLLDAGYSFVLAEGTEIKSVESFWRHIAESFN